MLVIGVCSSCCLPTTLTAAGTISVLRSLLVAALAGAVPALPQPVDPWELPSLMLERAEASDAIDLDRALAKEAPSSDEARALQTIFIEHGRAETNPPYERREYDRRQIAIHQAKQAFTDAHGAASLGAMRAKAVEDAVRFLDERGFAAAGDDTGIVGGFGEVLERYGAVHDGVLVAPPLTVRVFYKARWNSVHRLLFVDGFSPIELQAYWGWLALHGWGKPLQKRREALTAFRDAGGFGTEEAEALFDLLQGRAEEAEAELTRLHEASGLLRPRNLALGVRHASLLRRHSP